MTTPMIDPAQYDAVVFDLDGVITDSASVHAAAWQKLFDHYLASRVPSAGEDLSPFTADDYRRYVDGRPRYDGVTCFLRSRGIVVPPAIACALGDQKDHYFTDHLHQYGVQAFPGTLRLIAHLRAAGLVLAVISASRNCADVLAAADATHLFDIKVDGNDADQLGLPGKPDPAVFLLAARRLGVPPRRAVVVEDALAGVEAGRAGGFGLVIGVDRHGRPGELAQQGADVVVADLGEVEVGRAEAGS